MTATLAATVVVASKLQLLAADAGDRILVRSLQFAQPQGATSKALVTLRVSAGGKLLMLRSWEVTRQYVSWTEEIVGNCIELQSSHPLEISYVSAHLWRCGRRVDHVVECAERCVDEYDGKKPGAGTGVGMRSAEDALILAVKLMRQERDWVPPVLPHGTEARCG